MLIMDWYIEILPDILWPSLSQYIFWISLQLIWPSTRAKTCFTVKHENFSAFFVKSFIWFIFLAIQNFSIFTRKNFYFLRYLVTWKIGEHWLIAILLIWYSPICFFQRVIFWYYLLRIVLMWNLKKIIDTISTFGQFRVKTFDPGPLKPILKNKWLFESSNVVQNKECIPYCVQK